MPEEEWHSDVFCRDDEVVGADGIYGRRFAHNTDAFVSNFKKTKAPFLIACSHFRNSD